ncbi:Pyridoxine 4-dehydrogenase [Streptomyces sp. RB5]|uniref:Pyridoxine 4-dehydrogenase n=1 Tax=Streptomyces smaragdinus TaxID=2585196 RepID=A0A7K0CHS0_9ACTN|nr:aldo/keto reductase [Streptomyces smaragdinus]MQY13030.1 Pyridoxine 4-dehydrogenase [Streptomyces smaragdinus]
MTTPAAAAGTWTLGDLTVNRMGFGAMRLTHTADGTPLDRDRAIGVLRKAVELGVNHVDTAAFYFSGPRSANELIARALHPYKDVVVTTKVGPGKDPAGNWLGMARPDQLRGQVEENLRQLGRDHLDVVNLRLYRPGESLAEHFGVLAGLRTAGLIRHLGISNVRAERLAEARGIAPVVCVQNRYGVGAPAEERAVLDLCGRHGVAFVPFFAVAGEGREGGVTGDDHPAVRDVARARGLSEAQVRLAWTLGQGPHVLAIPGTGNPGHLAENVAAAGVRLTAEETAALDAV